MHILTARGGIGGVRRNASATMGDGDCHFTCLSVMLAAMRDISSGRGTFGGLSGGASMAMPG